MSRIIRVGSRESRLAVMQSLLVMDIIKKNHPQFTLELITMKTTGDIILDKSLDKIGGKGLFVKELDHALYNHQVDITVHSLKDMPMEVDDRLPLLAYSKREDPRDVLVLPIGQTELDFEKTIGCGSNRRCLQLQKLYPNIKLEGIRGNVQTRLNKVDTGVVGGTVLAYAGMKRLGLEDRVSRVFSLDEMIPSPGQGVLVVQGRKGEDTDYLNCIDDEYSRVCAVAERSFVQRLNGGCSSPIAAFGVIEGETLVLKGLYVEESTGRNVVGTLKGSKKDAKAMGIALADKLKKEI